MSALTVFLIIVALPFVTMIALAAIDKTSNNAIPPQTPANGSNATAAAGTTTNITQHIKQHPWWAGASGLLLLAVMLMDPLQFLYNQQLIALLLAGTGVVLIYQAISGKEKKVGQLLLGVTFLLLAPSLSMLALEGKKEVETKVTTWQACRSNPNQASCTNQGAQPGTKEVRATNFVGRANGTYTVRDDEWLVVEWPDGFCPWQLGGFGLLEKADDRSNTYAVLSPNGTQTVEFRTLKKGESWYDRTCS